MCMPAIAFVGELQMWAYLSGKTAGEKIEEYRGAVGRDRKPLSRPYTNGPCCRAHAQQSENSDLGFIRWCSIENTLTVLARSSTA